MWDYIEEGGADITLLEDIQMRSKSQVALYSVGSGASWRLKAAGTQC